jgi:paraquat-inducible protein A
MVLALMIFYVNSSGYTEATVLPGVYFFAASALMTMLAYGWAHTAGHPAAHTAHQWGEASSGASAALAEAGISSPAAASDVVSLPTNPARRHRPAPSR